MPAVGRCRYLGRCPLFAARFCARGQCTVPSAFLSLQVVTRPPNRWSKGVPLFLTTTLVFESFWSRSNAPQRDLNGMKE